MTRDAKEGSHHLARCVLPHALADQGRAMTALVNGLHHDFKRVRIHVDLYAVPRLLAEPEKIGRGHSGDTLDLVWPKTEAPGCLFVVILEARCNICEHGLHEANVVWVVLKNFAHCDPPDDVTELAREGASPGADSLSDSRQRSVRVAGTQLDPIDVPPSTLCYKPARAAPDKLEPDG